MLFSELFYQNDIHSIQEIIHKHLASHKADNIFISANFNNYSDSSALLASVSSTDNSMLIFFTDDFNLSERMNNLDKVLSFYLHGTSTADPRLLAKYFKIMPHEFMPDNIPHIWIDSNMSLKESFCSEIPIFLEADLAFFRHDKRNSVYEEFLECVKHKKDSAFNLGEAISLYEGSFPDYLAQGRVIFRSTPQATASFNCLWWKFITQTSIRDQVTLPFALKQSGVSFKLIDAELRSKFFGCNLHNKVQFSNLSTLSNFILTLRNYLLKCFRNPS